MPNVTATAGTWVLDPARSSVRFRSKTFWGLATVKGVFGTVEGGGEVAADGTARGTLTIDAASVDTKNGKRDTHLRSADFFHAEEHPSIVFTAAGISAPAEGSGVVEIDGELTVRGVTRPLSFPAQVSLTSPEEAVLEAEVTVSRADFGITWNQLNMMPAPTVLSVTAAFHRS
ncbi:YceI family protein [Actinacidiphila guanduensis]|uniref:Polyisoprenoid-binding protein YceI n=1 Tax=Actinacidiphila guanduensis TaxID=310781 RepID=A0A1H0HTI3_9ACTN|nr:YceI family protein [Actinacidiphila guanduensis]SDO22101.1 Polyisoprenoid-binding protein YceI [Actinacidiphila guanduensis]